MSGSFGNAGKSGSEKPIPGNGGSGTANDTDGRPGSSGGVSVGSAGNSGIEKPTPGNGGRGTESDTDGNPGSSGGVSVGSAGKSGIEKPTPGSGGSAIDGAGKLHLLISPPLPSRGGAR